MAFFCVVAPCSLVKVIDVSDVLQVMEEAIRTSEMSVNMSEISRRNISTGCRLQNRLSSIEVMSY